MPRYELSDGKSNKFWELERAGKSYTTTYGKIGSKGTSTTKSFASVAEARRAADKLISQKLKKGYVLDPDSLPPLGAVHPSARYFRFDDGKEGRFWEVWLVGSQLMTRTGKVGAKGTIKAKTLDSPGAAELQRDKRIAQKCKKGFVELLDSAPAPGTGVVDARNPKLEAAILANPEDPQAYAVFADWLQAQGDPRGELISLQRAGQLERAYSLLARHSDTLLGPLAEHQLVRDSQGYNPYTNLRFRSQPLSPRGYRDLSKAELERRQWQHEQAFTWRNGFIHRVRLSHDRYAQTWDGRCVNVLREVLAHPSGRYIVEFSFNSNGDPNEDDLQELIDLLAKRAPATTRKITLGDNIDQISWHHTGKLGKLWNKLPQLREVEIESGQFEVGKLVAPSLERAVFITGGLSRASGRAIARAQMPNIRHLEIYYGNSNYGAECSMKEVRPLLKRDDLPHLRYLGLENAEFSDDIARGLAGAKLLEGLETLDLSSGTLTDEGAEALAAAEPDLRHLQCLDVSDNYLSERGIEAVKGLCKQVIIGLQDKREDLYDEDEDEARYYVSVGE